METGLQFFSLIIKGTLSNTYFVEKHSWRYVLLPEIRSNVRNRWRMSTLVKIHFLVIYASAKCVGLETPKAITKIQTDMIFFMNFICLKCPRELYISLFEALYIIKLQIVRQVLLSTCIWNWRVQNISTAIFRIIENFDN